MINDKDVQLLFSNPKQIRAKVAVTEVANPRDDVELLVQVRVHLRSHNAHERKPDMLHGKYSTVAKMLFNTPRSQRSNALGARNDVQENNVLLLHTLLQEHLNGLHRTASSCEHWVLIRVSGCSLTVPPATAHGALQCLEGASSKTALAGLWPHRAESKSCQFEFCGSTVEAPFPCSPQHEQCCKINRESDECEMQANKPHAANVCVEVKSVIRGSSGSQNLRRGVYPLLGNTDMTVLHGTFARPSSTTWRTIRSA